MPEVACARSSATSAASHKWAFVSEAGCPAMCQSAHARILCSVGLRSSGDTGLVRHPCSL